MQPAWHEVFERHDRLRKEYRESFPPLLMGHRDKKIRYDGTARNPSATPTLIAVLLIVVLLAVGCSAFMAGQRSVYRGDPNVIQVGADRVAVENTLGPPDVVVSLDDGRAKAVYKLDPDAHTRAARNTAVVGHIIADILTLGLWEIVGTPVEIAAQDKLVTYVIYYGKDGKIEKVETVK